MKVQDLIQWLSECDPEAVVMMGKPSGDYWGREIANGPDEVIEESVEWSDYHSTWKVLTDEDEPDGQPHEVVIIR